MNKNYYTLESVERAMKAARGISCPVCASEYWAYAPENNQYDCHNCGHNWQDDLKAHLMKPLYKKETVLEEDL